MSSSLTEATNPHWVLPNLLVRAKELVMFETAAERKKRLAAKFKKRNLRVVQSSVGLTIVPNKSLKNICCSEKEGEKGCES
ncbi:hypothetical protein WN944_009244 [Citrus x changshan-huyou]|uniref:Uncharacterized protein n=1 Tax=Citrus x changshan-huyou TaxID=2935761 RepID=A0AAP0MRV1_9ROSI